MFSVQVLHGKVTDLCVDVLLVRHDKRMELYILAILVLGGFGNEH